MAPLGGVWGIWWTVRRLSQTIQEVCHRFPILCLSLKGTVPDSTGVLCLRGRGGHVVPTLGVDLGDVGVGSGFVHETIVRGQVGVWAACVPVSQLVLFLFNYR